MTAIERRDTAWKNSDLIPNWIRGREIDLDQHNTPVSVAEYCWDSLNKFLLKQRHQLNDFNYIEPSAGTGNFYDLLPEKNRIGIDIEAFPERSDYIVGDFVTWKPKKNGKAYISIGNPPFGYRGWLALVFLQHAAEFSEYVGFILPMSFQSEGKGAPKNRVRGMTLVHSEKLPDNLFIQTNGDKTTVNTLWQIWKRGENKNTLDLSACDEWIELFTVDQRKERLCGVEKMKHCNIFLQRTFFKTPTKIVNDFSKVKYSCGYGFIIKKDKKKIMKILRNADWVKYSNLAIHGCRHISMYHIKQLLLDNLM